MEALAALGIAGNVVQFLDFTGKLITGTRALYRSAADASSDSLVLHDVATDLERLSDAMITSDDCSERLLDLIASVKVVARDLLEIVSDLKLKGAKSRWKSFVIALKEMRSQDKIEAINRSIANLQRQITLHLQVEMTSTMSSLVNDIEELQKTSERLELNTAGALHQLTEGIASVLKEISVHGQETKIGEGQEGLVSALKQLDVGDVQHLKEMIPSFQSNMSILCESVQIAMEHHALLKHLYFDDLTSRSNSVSKAHAKTFEWIFRGVSSDWQTPFEFPNWLRMGDGIFWIRGKPGSGKSTLLKFLSGHPTTFQFLHEWSGAQQLVLASFYFWNSGTPLQKSLEGLLRSLLLEILRQCPELVPIAYNEFRDICAGQQDFVVWIELGNIMRVMAAVVNNGSSKKFCFMIDGLDEYEAAHTEDFQNLISFLKSLTASSSIKLCLSSRPWTVFVDAFGRDSSRCLSLEDLTREDIRTFVLDKFSQHNQYEKLIQMDPNYRLLADDVVKRSQGVFLWVFLVVRDLLEGLTYNDTVKTLHRRLEKFPKDLEGFFQHMMDAIPEFYRPHTVRALQVATSVNYPLPVATYSFLEDVEEDPDIIYEEARRPCTSHESLIRKDTMRRRLDAWCKGLLEVNVVDTDDRYLGPKVDFLHRTVRDFLLSGETDGNFKQSQPERLHTWLMLCNTMVVLFKRAPEGVFVPTAFRPGSTTTRFRDYTYTALEELAYFAKRAEDDGANPDELEQIIAAALDAASELEDLSIMNVHQEFLGPASQNGLLLPLQRQLPLGVPSCSITMLHLVDFLSCALTPSAISGEFYPEAASHILRYTDSIDLYAKDLFKDVFERFISNIGMGAGKISPRKKGVPDIVRSIALTGYELHQRFVRGNFPQFYSEMMGMELGKRTLEDLSEDQVESAVKRIRC